MRFNLNKQRLKGIWERNAFYILLAVCVLVMGAVAWTSRGRADTPDSPPIEEQLQASPSPGTGADNRELARIKDLLDQKDREFTAIPDKITEDEPVEGEEQEEVTDEPGQKKEPAPEAAGKGPDGETASAGPPGETDAEPAPPGDQPLQEAVETAAEAQEWLCPLRGTVITPYAADRLIYWETLDAWRIHPAVDIKPEADTAVYAATDGTVTLVTEDSLLGWMVVIDHGKGLSACYASLSEDILVEAGDKISAGKQIGSAGRSARSEQAAGTHLHFAVWQDSQSQDPLSYISIP